jgi:hypothetical protein
VVRHGVEQGSALSGSGPLLADITFNEDFVIWVIGPPVLSILVVSAGLFVRRQSPPSGRALVFVGVAGLVASMAWIAFGFYIDALLGDT